MNLLEIGTSELTPDEQTAALVVPVWNEGAASVVPDGVVPDHLRSVVDAALSFASQHGFKAKTGDTTVVPVLEDDSLVEAIVLAGLGPRAGAGAEQIRKAAGAAIRRAGDYEGATLLLHRSLGTNEAIHAAIEGACLATYRFDDYKTAASKTKLARLVLPGADEVAVKRGRVAAQATILARDLINEPPSMLTPAILAERAEALAADAGMTCDVWDVTKLEEKGCGGILGVGQGSIAPPRLIHLRYRPEGATHRVALVGKGITFDSGGLSIKDAKSMETMKTDMSGAAAVIATTWAAAKLGLSIEIDAWVPSAENMLGDAAMKPGDVLRHYGGKTTEVLNTDAEGRLVLADALALAAESGPSAIVDVATLTGSMVVALGKKITGLFASTDALRDELIGAGARAGEDMWAFPLYEAYRKDLDSEVADQRNIATRWGGAIYAALFLSAFVPEGIDWAHLDIAGTARSESDSGYMSRGGTGVGTRTLLSWLEGRITGG